MSSWKNHNFTVHFIKSKIKVQCNIILIGICIDVEWIDLLYVYGICDPFMVTKKNRLASLPLRYKASLKKTSLIKHPPPPPPFPPRIFEKLYSGNIIEQWILIWNLFWLNQFCHILKKNCVGPRQVLVHVFAPRKAFEFHPINNWNFYLSVSTPVNNMAIKSP